MKHLLAFLLLLSLAAFRPGAATYQADAAASQLTWTGHAEAGTWAPTSSITFRTVGVART